MNDQEKARLQALEDRMLWLGQQVGKLDRLVSKLFKRLPQPNQYRQD